MPDGRIRKVTQLQMIVWPDLEAPEDARYPPSTYSLLKHSIPINRQLVDMVQRVVELQVKAMCSCLEVKVSL